MLIVSSLKPILAMIPAGLVCLLTREKESLLRSILKYILSYAVGFVGFVFIGSALLLVIRKTLNIETDVLVTIDKIILEGVVWSVIGCVVGRYSAKRKYSNSTNQIES